MVGKTISHYKILEKLGEGGMGEVYLAEDLKLERKVAIKFLPQHLTKDKENVERFEREAKAAASLNHPNIVTIHDIIEEDNQIYIVMEYVEGKSLRDLISPKSQFPIPNYVDIITQISEGLSQAHQAGIVHRDIKPENILIDKDARVKILDFGLAKLKGVSKLTKESSTLGTVHYMSPEQLRGEEVDHRSDIWSLGVVFYEMLTGDVPFKGDYDQAVAYSIHNEEPEPISGIAPEHNELLHKLLAKEPEKRYQSLEILAEVIIEKDSKVIKKIIKPKRYIIYSVGLISILIIGYFLNSEVNIDASKDSSTEWDNSIAVLPFSDLSPSKDQEYFCDGMTEQIITNLSKIERLKVIARTSIMTYKNTKKQIPEIGRELNVSHILEGSIRKYGNNIRVTAQLIDTRDGSHIWADDFDRELEHVFEVQDDVSESIATNLLTNLSRRDITEIKTNRPSNTKAYEYYMKGRYFHLNKYHLNGNSNDFITSEKMFKKALKLDPNFADSYASLADLYNSYYYNLPEDSGEKHEYIQLQEAYLDTAYQLNPNSAEVQYAKGLLYQIKTLYKEAYICYRAAIKINPNNAYYYQAMGFFLYWRGCVKLAIQSITKAIDLNPLNPSYYFYRGIQNGMLGKFDIAEKDFNKALEINPDDDTLIPYWLLLSFQKRNDAADSLLEIMERSISIQKVEYIYALQHALKGHKDKAMNNLKSEIWYERIIIFALLDMRNETMSILSEITEQFQRTESSRYLQLKNFFVFDKLRSDPRFQEILAKHKELYEENLRKYGDIDI